MIIMAQETLLFRWTGFSPVLWLLIPAFSLDNAPPNLTVRLRCDINAPLPRHALVASDERNESIFNAQVSMNVAMQQ